MSDQERMAVWETLLRTVSTLLRTFERELQESDGLPLTWFDVLIQLYEAPEKGLRMQALADSVVLSRSGITRLIDRMERAGLVRREASKEDRRGYYAVITDEGLRVIGLARPLHHRGIREHFANHLDDKDVEALNIALGKVRAHLQLSPMRRSSR
jgi:DNA-binding MarR family transcriptional regulator